MEINSENYFIFFAGFFTVPLAFEPAAFFGVALAITPP